MRFEGVGCWFEIDGIGGWVGLIRVGYSRPPLLRVPISNSFGIRAVVSGFHRKGVD